jgi:hypothetical protein
VGREVAGFNKAAERRAPPVILSQAKEFLFTFNEIQQMLRRVWRGKLVSP